MKESIDFGTMKVSVLFRKLLIPTLLGMISSALFIITDGIFVGKCIGSDALAAVNITAPLFFVSTGVSLMFGIGASVMASVHLSQGKTRMANMVITQAVVASSLLMVIYALFILLNAQGIVVFLGSSVRLLPLAQEYLSWFAPFLIFSSLLSAGMFFVRLGGSPNYAMVCNIVAAFINIGLDYLFIFVFQWGMFGAALATSLGYIIGSLMIFVYLLQTKRALHLSKIRYSLNSIRFALWQVGYMCRLGVSTFLCEIAIAVMMLVGNYTFIRHLGEDGVAAFSIACYIFPIIFMMYNAIAQSAQPILSYNYGQGNKKRVGNAFRLALTAVVVCGMGLFLLAACWPDRVVWMFVDSSTSAYDIAVRGLPLFASGFIFFGINMVSIVFFQSIERDRSAMVITVLRSFVFMLLCFWFMPTYMGVSGIWLAVPASELMTTFIIGINYIRETRRGVIIKQGQIIG